MLDLLEGLVQGHTTEGKILKKKGFVMLAFKCNVVATKLRRYELTIVELCHSVANNKKMFAPDDGVKQLVPKNYFGDLNPPPFSTRFS